MDRSLTVTTRSPEETRILGAALAPQLVPGDVLSLGGELGAGKTTFVQGLGAALGVEGRITSPTFTIVHEYSGRYPLVHVDVYRLDHFQEVIDLGFEEMIDPEAILIVEWGDAIGPLLPTRYVEIEIRMAPPGEEERVITFRPHGGEWVHKLAEMARVAEALLNAVSTDDSAGRFIVGDGV